MIKEIEKFSVSLAAGAVCFLPYLAFLAFLALTESVSDSQYQHSDPLIRFFGYPTTTIITLVLGVLVSYYWIRRFEVTKHELKVALLWTALGAGFSVSVLLAIYFINGPVIPSFIPPEESSQSGMLLGLSAGMFEEVSLRLMLLPFILGFLTRKLSFNIAAIVSAVIIGVLFTLSHELAGDPFNIRYFFTRFLVPGFVMTMVFIKLHPAAMLSGHSASHIMIATLFVSNIEA